MVKGPSVNKPLVQASNFEAMDAIAAIGLRLFGLRGVLPGVIVSSSCPMSSKASTQSSCFPAGNDRSSDRSSGNHVAFCGA